MNKNANWILSGPIGSGKTTCAYTVAKRLNSAGIVVGGIVSPGIDAEGKRIGYNSIDLLSGQEVPFARLKNLVDKPSPDDILIGRWIIFQQSLSFCEKAILQAIEAKVSLIVIDEVGPLELQGRGLKPVLDKALDACPAKLIVVRSSLVTELINLCRDYDFEVFTIKGQNISASFNEEIFEKIYTALAKQPP